MINLDKFLQTLAVFKLFPPMIFVYRRDNFNKHDWGCTSIYHIVLSLKVPGIKGTYYCVLSVCRWQKKEEKKNFVLPKANKNSLIILKKQQEPIVYFSS